MKIDRTAERLEKDKAQIDKCIERFNARASDELAPLYSQLLTHNEERKYLARRVASLNARYRDPSHRDYHSRRAKTYRAIDLFLPRKLVERLTGVPLEKTEDEYRLIVGEERRLRRMAEVEEERVGLERSPLLERRRELERARERQELEEAEETTVVPEVASPQTPTGESTTRFDWREGLVTIGETPQPPAAEIHPEIVTPQVPERVGEREAGEEKEEREKLPVGIVRKRLERGEIKNVVVELNEEEIEKLVRTRANRIVRQDPRMVADCETIIKSLREDPFGEGVNKLESMQQIIGTTRYDLWSFHPRERAELSFQHRQTASWSGFDMRVIYFFYRKNSERIIVLHRDGIYTHEQYNRVIRRARHGR